MDAPTPLDWIMLRRDEVKALLDGTLHNARVAGWAGAGKDFGPRGPASVRPCVSAALADSSGSRSSTGS